MVWEPCPTANAFALMEDRQDKAEAYRARAKEARERAEHAPTAVVRNTLLEDAEMFERMAQSEERRKRPENGPSP